MSDLESGWAVGGGTVIFGTGVTTGGVVKVFFRLRCCFLPANLVRLLANLYPTAIPTPPVVTIRTVPIPAHPPTPNPLDPFSGCMYCFAGLIVA